MASPLAHIAVGSAVAVILTPRRAPRGFFWVVVGLCLLPDLLLNFAGDWAPLLTKSVAAEVASSVPFALVIALMLAGVFQALLGRPRFGHLNTNSHGLRWWRGALIFALVYVASATVNGFAGQPMHYYWPFEAAPYVAGIDFLPRWFPNPLNWQPLLKELLWVVLPSLLIAGVVALFRERISGPPRIPHNVDLDETGDRLAR